MGKSLGSVNQTTNAAQSFGFPYSDSDLSGFPELATKLVLASIASKTSLWLENCCHNVRIVTTEGHGSFVANEEATVSVLGDHSLEIRVRRPVSHHSMQNAGKYQ